MYIFILTWTFLKTVFSAPEMLLLFSVWPILHVFILGLCRKYMPDFWHYSFSINALCRHKTKGQKSEGWYFEFVGISWSDTWWTSDQIYNNDDVILFNLPVLLHRLFWFKEENFSNFWAVHKWRHKITISFLESIHYSGPLCCIVG